MQIPHDPFLDAMRLRDVPTAAGSLTIKLGVSMQLSAAIALGVLTSPHINAFLVAAAILSVGSSVLAALHLAVPFEIALSVHNAEVNDDIAVEATLAAARSGLMVPDRIRELCRCVGLVQVGLLMLGLGALI